ncbi:MAG: T9SS type A sorting domain-containing protein [Rhodothermales bacterium]
MSFFLHSDRTDMSRHKWFLRATSSHSHARFSLSIVLGTVFFVAVQPHDVSAQEAQIVALRCKVSDPKDGAYPVAISEDGSTTAGQIGCEKEVELGNGDLISTFEAVWKNGAATYLQLVNGDPREEFASARDVAGDGSTVVGGGSYSTGPEQSVRYGATWVNGTLDLVINDARFEYVSRDGTVIAGYILDQFGNNVTSARWDNGNETLLPFNPLMGMTPSGSPYGRISADSVFFAIIRDDVAQPLVCPDGSRFTPRSSNIDGSEMSGFCGQSIGIWTSEGTFDEISHPDFVRFDPPTLSYDGAVGVMMGVDQLNQRVPLRWTRDAGVEPMFDLLDALDSQHPGWSHLDVIGLSGDGTTVLATVQTPDQLGFTFTADPCVAAASAVRAGKRATMPADCECAIGEVFWDGEDSDVFTDPQNWAGNRAPRSDELVHFPDLGQPYTVDNASGEAGEIELAGELTFSGSLTLNAPCGTAIRTSGGGPNGTRLNLDDAVLIANGGMEFPDSEDGVVEIQMSGSRIELAPGVEFNLGTRRASSANLSLTDVASEISGLEARLTVGSNGDAAVVIGDLSELSVGRISIGAQAEVAQDEVGIGSLELLSGSELTAFTLEVGMDARGALTASGATLSADSLIAGLIGRAELHLSDASVFTVESLLGLLDSVTVVVDSDTRWENLGDMTLAESTDSFALFELAGDSSKLEIGVSLHVGGSGKASMVLSNGAQISAAITTVGLRSTAEGTVTIEANDPPQSSTLPQLETDLFAIGYAGKGRVDVTRASIVATSTGLAAEEGSDGTLFLSDNAVLTGSSLTVGNAGLGDMRVADQSTVDVDTVIVGGYGGGFGSMNVDTSTVVSNLICVGCVRGTGFLGVDRSDVRTHTLRVGPLGVVRGEASIVYVTKETENLASKNAGQSRSGAVAEPGVYTEQLFLSTGAELDVDSLVVTDGTIGGSAGWPTSFTNAGTISPGDSTFGLGTFPIGGDFIQTAVGVLQIELGGTADGAYDVVAVSGDASLSGTIELSLINNFVPMVGDSFVVLTATGIVGTFDTIVFASDFIASVNVESNGVRVTVTSTVAREDDVITEIPETTTLHPIYPNPTNGSATIPFDVATPGVVRIDVFDVRGRQVAVVANTRFTVGTHVVELENGQLATGVYLVRMTTGGASHTRKLMVVR